MTNLANLHYFQEILKSFRIKYLYKSVISHFFKVDIKNTTFFLLNILINLILIYFDILLFLKIQNFLLMLLHFHYLYID